jgi:hypothetical protein
MVPCLPTGDEPRLLEITETEQTCLSVNLGAVRFRFERETRFRKETEMAGEKEPIFSNGTDLPSTVSGALWEQLRNLGEERRRATCAPRQTSVGS